ncbi:MAG TPA: TorF family putative porin [Allosphingosinicella sp.]|nr:TorF family putative porin [Allosphingosinicella sp.]
MLDLPSPDPSIEIVIASQGMSKGLRQTDGVQLVVRPEIAFGHAYAGLLAKNVTSPVTDAEGQAFVGYRTHAGGFELNASIGYHHQLGVHGRTDADRFEFTASAARPIGPVTPRLAATYSPDDFGATRQSLYLEGGASVTVFRGTSLSVNLGRRERVGGPDYTSFNAGVSYALTRWLNADLRYYDTAQSALGAIYEPRLIGSVRLRF